MKNIIIFNIKKAMLVIAVIGVMSACEDNEVEKKFDKPYTERIQAQISELRTSLMASEHGWKTVYITDKERFGGFNFIFKFTGENTVEMASDFSAVDTVFRNSEYAIKNASTVKLSFTTQNAIHKLSDAGNSPILEQSGAGYKGDLEFLYYGKDGEDLIFRGNKTNGNSDNHVEIRFVKAESDGLDNIKESFKKRMVINLLLVGGAETSVSVYRTLSIIKNGEEAKFSYNYNNSLLFLNVNAEDDSESFSSPIYFTEKGFVISNLKTGTEEFTDIEIPLSSYDAAKDEFTVNIENVTVILDSEIEPPLPVNGHKEIIDPAIVAQLDYFHRDTYLPAGLTTPGFEELYEAANATGFAFLNDFVSRGSPPDFFFILHRMGRIFSYYTYEDRDDRIVFNRVFTRDARLTDSQNAMLDFLFDDEGFYVENLGAVTQFSYHIYTFTSVKNPSIRIAFYNIK